jgi:Protein of unknown function (DUF3309)
MLTILLVVLLVLLLTGSGGWGYASGHLGPFPATLVGLLAVVLIVYLVFMVTEPVLPLPPVR